jgi:hypothetical protein
MAGHYDLRNQEQGLSAVTAATLMTGMVDVVAPPRIWHSETTGTNYYFVCFTDPCPGKS